jgi:hypothetical protein
MIPTPALNPVQIIVVFASKNHFGKVCASLRVPAELMTHC